MINYKKIVFALFVLFIGMSAFSMQKSGNITGKSVTIIQTGSGNQKIGNISSDGDIVFKQTNDDSYEININLPDSSNLDTMNGYFAGYDIDVPEFELKTTDCLILFRGKEYPYDGSSKCQINNGKLRIIISPSECEASSVLKYIVIGGAIVVAGAGLAYYLDSDSQ